MSFSRKIILFVTLLISLIGLGTSVSLYSYIERLLFAVLVDVSAERNETAVTSINNFIKEKIADQQMFVSSGLFKAPLQNTDSIFNYLRDIRNLYQTYESFIYIDNAFKVRIHTSRVDLDETYAYSEILKNIKDNQITSFDFRSQNIFFKGKLILATKLPDLKGYVVSEIPLARLKDFLINFERPIAGFIKPKFRILNHNGQVLYSTYDKDEPELSTASFKKFGSYLANFSDTYVYIRDNNLPYGDSEGAPWTLETQINTSEIETPIHTVRNILILVTVVFFGLSLIVFTRWLTRQFKPIATLQKKMDAIGQGKFEQIEIDDLVNMDVKHLIRGFNAMSQRLEKNLFDLNNASKFAALGEMASGIAHEINNPLQIIRGFAETQKKYIQNGNPDKALEFSEKITLATGRIAKIVSALRTYARNEKQDPMQEEYVKKIIEDTMVFCEQKFKLKAIDLKVNFSEDNIFIDCRPVQMSQTLLNLLNNAYDAIVDNDEDKWVLVDISQTQEHVIIRVSNSGTKISSEIADRIFQPFFTTKEIGRGTGMGLSISKNLIEGNNGTIQLDLEAENTCFLIILPRPQSDIIANVA